MGLFQKLSYLSQEWCGFVFCFVLFFLAKKSCNFFKFCKVLLFATGFVFFVSDFDCFARGYCFVLFCFVLLFLAKSVCFVFFFACGFDFFQEVLFEFFFFSIFLFFFFFCKGSCFVLHFFFFANALLLFFRKLFVRIFS